MRLTYWNDRKGHFDWHCENNEIADKLAAYEDTGYSPLEIKSLEGEWSTMRKVVDSYRKAEEQGFLVRLPCKVGDNVRDKIADYVFTINRVELGHKSGMLFVCGNHGTDDYMAFYDFEIGEKIEILTRAEAEAALKGGPDDV